MRQRQRSAGDLSPMSNAAGQRQMRLHLQRVLTRRALDTALRAGASGMSDEETMPITLTVNGERVSRTVPVRQHLVDFLRTDLGLTGAHLGCEHGVCGACSVRVDGAVVRGCLMLAVQADGADVVTIEGLTDTGEIADLQEAFVDRNALQCGFCTPGMLMTAAELLREGQQPRPARRSARSCPATTAAAPAITPSSMQSPRRLASPREGRPRRERQDPPRPLRQAQQLRRPHPVARRRQARGRRARPLHRRLLARRACCTPPSCAARSHTPESLSIDTARSQAAAGRRAGDDRRRAGQALHRTLGRHAHLLSRHEVGAAVSDGRRPRLLGRRAGGDGRGAHARRGRGRRGENHRRMGGAAGRHGEEDRARSRHARRSIPTSATTSPSAR